jgi:6-pyruvoyltetrahydropterin/6-carboxytetrahydropterin synthase
MKHIITKDFDFCYGHRVWSQTLNEEFSLDSCLKCRHLHGHQGKIAVSLEASHLTEGMVTDFKHLNWFKKWLDDTLDHKFIMDVNDPLFGVLIPTTDAWDGEPEDNPPIIWYAEGYGMLNLKDYMPNQLKNGVNEFLEGMVFVRFVPTSENLSKWFFEIISEKMVPLKVQVNSVRFNETPKSMAEYTTE